MERVARQASSCYGKSVSDFRNANGKLLPLPKVVREIRAFMRKAPSCDYCVMIGTDSQRHADGRANFVTAIVVHRVGHGARYFWRKTFNRRRFFKTIRERMYAEALATIRVASAWRMLAARRHNRLQGGAPR